MSRMILLDAGPLGMYANPNANAKNKECRRRVDALLVAGDTVRAPGIAVYEVRRELVHLQFRQPATKRLVRFDAATSFLGLVVINEEVMRRATEIWGDARSRGITTAPKEALDGDVILAAQAFLEQAKGNHIQIATSNSSDLANLFPNVLNWDDLKT
jgi:hypothetical protein